MPAPTASGPSRRRRAFRPPGRRHPRRRRPRCRTRSSPCRQAERRVLGSVGLIAGEGEDARDRAARIDQGHVLGIEAPGRDDPSSAGRRRRRRLRRRSRSPRRRSRWSAGRGLRTSDRAIRSAGTGRARTRFPDRHARRSRRDQPPVRLCDQCLAGVVLAEARSDLAVLREPRVEVAGRASATAADSPSATSPASNAAPRADREAESRYGAQRVLNLSDPGIDCGSIYGRWSREVR